LKLAPTALAAALLPALAAGRPRELAQGVGAGLALGAGVVLLSQWIGAEALAVLFGASFAASAEALRLLSVAFALASLNAVLIAQLYAWGLEARAARALACALAANVALNLALAPSAGAAGAARAAVCSEAVLLGCYLLLLRRGAASRASGSGSVGTMERLALAEEPAS
jgi:O-antigen/teichoic acid export membrane protein